MMRMRLIHYSNAETLGDREAFGAAVGRLLGAPRAQRADLKPEGLWVSDEDGFGWRAWCEAEGWGLGEKHAYEVELRPDHSVLIVSGEDQLDAFHREYRLERTYYTTEGARRAGITLVSWDRVAERHHGVIVSPYLWSRRLGDSDMLWYYGWDCAGGCVWDPASVRRVRYLGTETWGEVS